MSTFVLLAAGVILSCSQNEQGHQRAEKIGTPLPTPVEAIPFDREARDTCAITEREDPQLDKHFERTPYLQMVGPHQAAVLWSSRFEGKQRLHWWHPETKYGPRALARPDGERHPYMAQQYSSMASGLQPKQRYCYEVLFEEEVVFRSSFKTAPATASSAVKLAAFGDLGKDSRDQHAVRKVLRSLSPDAVLVTGDVAYDAGRLFEYERYFFSVYPELLSQLPFFPASGNHDYASDGAESFRQVFALPPNGGPKGIERWYSFDWGPAHIAVLDTERRLETQAAWLREDLTRTKRPWKLVVAHRPPYSSGSHGGSAEVAKTLVPVFVEQKVDLVLAGHEHDYERTVALDGVTYVVTGGGGRGTRPVGSSDFTAFASRVAHLVYLEIDDERLRLRAIDATGQEFDGLELTRE